MILEWINRWFGGRQTTNTADNNIPPSIDTAPEPAAYSMDSAQPVTEAQRTSTLHTYAPHALTDNQIAANAMPISSADPDSGISYSPNLIESLMDDHNDLLELYSAIAHVMAEGRFDEIPEALTLFKTKLDVHLLTENLRFYCYLEQNLGENAQEREIMKNFRREMSTIARAVVTFIRKWQAHIITAENKDEYLSEYAQIGDALAQRIEREEKGLYTLYMAA